MSLMGPLGMVLLGLVTLAMSMVILYLSVLCVLCVTLSVYLEDMVLICLRALRLILSSVLPIEYVHEFMVFTMMLEELGMVASDVLMRFFA